MAKPGFKPLFNHIRRMLLLSFLLWCSGYYVDVSAQSENQSACNETLGFYQDHGYIVKAIRVRPLFKFIPFGPQADAALQSAIDKLRPSGSTLLVDDPFNLRKLSLLANALNVEIDNTFLRGQTGFSYITTRVRNCNDEVTPPTLEVDYVLITAARPSYKTGSFELRGRRSQNKEQAGDSPSDEAEVLPTPYIGYNRSRGIYAGTALSMETGKGIFEKLDLDASASNSSGVADLSLSGSREFESGLLSFAEWRLGYRYSSVPADTIRLKDATVTGQFFGATRPIGSRNLFFRFGTSVEGGNRQTNLDEDLVPESSLAQSGYGAIKLYFGGTFGSNRQDVKASYGLQLGNSGDGFRVDYIKHIFDTAYRLRVLPRDHRPFQADLHFTAGKLHSVDGDIPIVERFFGGNVERQFIQGDSWSIRSNPFIRSFPQNRLNRSESGLPIGGTNFVSFNLTLAQTVWGRQLLPKEIELDPNLTGALGGQLLTVRRVFREDEIQASKQVQDLKQLISNLTPTIDALEAELNKIKSNQIPDVVSKDIEMFFNAAPDSGIAPIPDSKDAIEAAMGEPAAPDVSSARVDNSQVEANANTLAKDSPEDDTKALITVLRENISKLLKDLSDNGLGSLGSGLAPLDAQLGDSQTRMKDGLALVGQLRAYKPEEIEQLVGKLNEPSPKSGKTLDKILDDIQAQIKPVKETVKQELESLPSTTNDEAGKLKRESLLDFQRQLDVVDGFAAKAKVEFEFANELNQGKKFNEAKISVESLTIGYGGGIPSYITGVALGIRALKNPFAERGLESQWKALDASAQEALAIQSQVKSDFKSVDVPQTEQNANLTVSFIGRVLGTFFRELNIVGVSPVVMFDAARLGPVDPPDRGGFRYGLGAGMRFSLVNVDFTAGYSFNLNRRPGEGRGALTFSLDINDLFR